MLVNPDRLLSVAFLAVLLHVLRGGALERLVPY
jgi:hypothetical protein